MFIERSFNLDKLWATCFIFLLLTACQGGENRTNIELIQDMMDQDSIKAQDWDPETPNKTMMRVPPENTVARNKSSYPYHLDYKAAERNLSNPYTNENTPEILGRGKEYFRVYCAVCHGERATGDSLVAGKMMAVKPPSLLTSRVINYSDGRLFHIITDGQGLMSGYASQISSEDDRWAIINYLRTLQKD